MKLRPAAISQRSLGNSSILTVKVLVADAQWDGNLENDSLLREEIKHVGNGCLIVDAPGQTGP